MPSDRDLNLYVSPAKARELQAMLDWFQRFNGKAGFPDGFISRAPTNSRVPIPKLGKAHDNIAPRTFGAVDIWAGKPGSETQLTFLTSPVQEFNLLDRTITAGKWVWMFGQYIFGAHFPARQVDCRLTASLTGGGSASATVLDFCDGDDPGATITVLPSPQLGSGTLSSGKIVFAMWDDKQQAYIARGWGC